MYETSATDMSRPRQCVPLACVKYVRSRSSIAPAPSSATAVCHTGTLSELAARPTSVTHSHNSSSPQSGHNVACSYGVSIASSSRSSSASVQHVPARSVRQQSVPSNAVPTLQHSRCHSTANVSSPVTLGVGLASAVWTPMGATLQHVPEQHRAVDVDVVQPPCHAEQLRLLAIHHRLTISFNEEFSRHMNSIISVMHDACRAASSHVFQYALDRLRLLRFKYCQLTEICVAYGEYQKHVRNNRSVTLPTVSCLHWSIQVIMNSVNAVTAVFHEMNQWLSTDTRMTVTERGLGLSNKLCHFVPVFVQEMSNFKRSLQMIVPNTVSAASPSSAPAVRDALPSVSSYNKSPAAAMQTAPNYVANTVAQSQDENGELCGQNVEPIFVAPIVIEPDGQPDDEFGMIQVKQEPVELDRKRGKTLAELIYVDDDDAAASAADIDDVSFMLASQFNAHSSLTLGRHLPASQHLDELSADNQMTACQARGMSSSGVNEVLSAAAVHYQSSDSVNERLNSAMHADVGGVETVMSAVSASSVLPVFAVHSTVATITSALYTTSHLRTSSSSSPVTAVSTGEYLFSSTNANCVSGILRASDGQQSLDIETTGDVSVTNRCISDSPPGAAGKTKVTQGSKVTVSSCNELKHSLINGDRSSIENGCRVASAERCSGRSASNELAECLSSFDLNNEQSSNRDISSKQVAGTAAHNHAELALDEMSNVASAELHDSLSLIHI